MLAAPVAPEGLISAQGIYRLARDQGWVLEYTHRMHGLSVGLTDPKTGLVASAFAEDEEAAWDALARDYNDAEEYPEENEFWHEPFD